MTTKQIQAIVGVAQDGSFGPKTKAAVKAWQQAHGLVADGVVGPKTLAAMGGGGGSAAPAAGAAATPSLDQTQLAQQYGFAMAVLNSDPDLKNLFSRAVAETWTPERFQAQLRSTPWYQSHNEQWRNAQILKASDPQSYASNVAQVNTRLSMLASEMGAQLGGHLGPLAEQAYTLGWDDNQIRANLSTYVQYTDGRMLGQAGQWETEAKGFAADNGLNLSSQWYQQQISSASAGTQTFNDVKKKITEMAASGYPHLADRLRAGETLATIADPYRQTMAQLLELNPDAVTMQDPSVKAALSAKGADGKPVLKTLYDFENDTRNDPRWLKTKGAQDQASSTVHKVLADFGVL